VHPVGFRRDGRERLIMRGIFDSSKIRFLLINAQRMNRFKNRKKPGFCIFGPNCNPW
jgi:hypothetical protein